MSALTAAWQSALAAEHQAVFGYELLGPHLPAGEQAAARAAEQEHAARRDSTAGALTAAGLVPVEPLADYPALYPVADSGAARRLAVRLEDACAQAWRVLYLRAASEAGAAARALRAPAQAALDASAVGGTRWRQRVDPARATTPFPGL